MKKLLLTAVIACSTLIASAQIMLMTAYDGDLEGATQLTGNVGVAFQASDQITAGMQRNTAMVNGDFVELDATTGDSTFTQVEEATYNLFVRYTVKDDIYAIFEMPTKDGSDRARVGLGYSFQVMNNFYFEPSYTMLMKEVKEAGSDNGDRMAKFSMGIAYKL